MDTPSRKPHLLTAGLLLLAFLLLALGAWRLYVWQWGDAQALWVYQSSALTQEIADIKQCQESEKWVNYVLGKDLILTDIALDKAGSRVEERWARFLESVQNYRESLEEEARLRETEARAVELRAGLAGILAAVLMLGLVFRRWLRHRDHADAGKGKRGRRLSLGNATLAILLLLLLVSLGGVLVTPSLLDASLVPLAKDGLDKQYVHLSMRISKITLKDYLFWQTATVEFRILGFTGPERELIDLRRPAPFLGWQATSVHQTEAGTPSAPREPIVPAFNLGYVMLPDSVAGLTKALRSEDAKHHYWAVQSLGRVVPPTKRVVPALQEALQDKDPDVREEASAWLKRINSLPLAGLNPHTLPPLSRANK